MYFMYQRASFRPADPPSGLPPRAAYYDGGAGAVGGSSSGAGAGGNAFGNGGGFGGGAGGYSQAPAAQPSPFARGPAPTNAFFSAANGSAGGYRQAGPATGPGPAGHQQGFGPDAGFGSEVALVPAEANGDGRGRNVMDDADDDDDDDDMPPTRSLADGDHLDAGGDGASAAEGLRYRRGGGGGGREGTLVGGFSAERPDTQRATWVVVWGVPPGAANEVLTRFLIFGQVEEQRGQPGSNWLYLK